MKTSAQKPFSFLSFFTLITLFSFFFKPISVFACEKFTVPERIVTGSTFATEGTFPPIRVTGAKSNIWYTLNAYPSGLRSLTPTGLSSYKTTGTDLLFETDPITLGSGTYLLMAEANTNEFCTSNNFTVIDAPTQTPTPTPTLPSPTGNMQLATTKEVTVEQPVEINIANIPFAQDAYALKLTPSKNNIEVEKLRNASGVISAFSFITDITENPLLCIIPVYDSSRWSSASCRVGEDGNSFTLTARLSTDDLTGDKPDPTKVYPYDLTLFNIQNSKVGSVGFIVKPKNYKPSFDIKFIYQGEFVESAQPGQEIIIKLSGIDMSGNYEYGVGNKRENLTDKTTGICDPNLIPNCYLKLKVPTTNKSSILISVFDNEGKTASKELGIPGGIGGEIAPPTPTPTPTVSFPPPPCSKWVDASGADVSAPLNGEEAKNKNLKCAQVNTAVGDVATDPAGFVAKVFSVVLSISGGIAVVLIILGGYKLMMSQGNQEKAQAAKETLTSAIVGLLFIIFSIAILQIIGVDILKIPGFG